MTDSNPLDRLTEDDRTALTTALKGMKESDPRPAQIVIPMDVDLDGDGKVDGWGLDDDNNLIFVSGVDVADTGYESDGHDITGQPSTATSTTDVTSAE